MKKIAAIFFFLSIVLILSLFIGNFTSKVQIFKAGAYGNISINANYLTIIGNLGLNATATSGNGTILNPYIIEDLTIDAGGYEYGILIQDTDAHFIMQNCTIRNALLVGIYLDNVTNALIFINQVINISGISGISVSDSNYNKILNNVITDCFHGISLYSYSQNNEIIRNTVVSSINTGIWFDYMCEYNTFSSNIVNISGFYGIHLEYASHNQVLNNEIYDSGTGIDIRLNSHNITLINNSLVDNVWKGIYITGDQNRLINNTVVLSYRGIHLESSDSNILDNNTVSSNFYGIELAPCTRSNLTANTICNNSYGIHFWAAPNNTLIDNTINHNSVDGLWIYNTQYSNITHNIISFNKRGIYLDSSGNNSITWNLLEKNQECIVGSIVGNYISNNTCIQIPEPPYLSPISPNPNTIGIIYLNWSAENGALYYLIYRDTSCITDVIGLLPIANVTKNNYTDRVYTNGNYYYVVIAAYVAGNSTPSNCVNVTIASSGSPPIAGFELVFVFGSLIIFGIFSLIEMKRSDFRDLPPERAKRYSFWISERLPFATAILNSLKNIFFFLK